MSGFWVDLKLAWRTIYRAPVFSAVIILVLALGVGANSAIFSVVKSVVLDPLPYPGSDQLVIVWENDRYLPEGLWRSAFGGDPGVVGRDILLDGEPHTVVGIVPAAARLAGTATQLWVPYAIGE